MRSRLDHVSRADPPQLLGPPGALGADGAVVQAAVLRGIVVYARTALGAACRARRAGKMDRVRLSACLLDPAFCDGLDGRDLGRRGRSPATEDLAGAAA